MEDFKRFLSYIKQNVMLMFLTEINRLEINEDWLKFMNAFALFEIINSLYFAGNHHILGQSCKISSQCTGTENAGICLDGICFCQDGFVLHRLQCLPGTFYTILCE